MEEEDLVEVASEGDTKEEILEEVDMAKEEEEDPLNKYANGLLKEHAKKETNAISLTIREEQEHQVKVILNSEICQHLKINLNRLINHAIMGQHARRRTMAVHTITLSNNLEDLAVREVKVDLEEDTVEDREEGLEEVQEEGLVV